MKKVVVLTGAGMSAESGISTFRDADGLWEGHDVMEVASPAGWQRNPALVQDFYNQRRKAILEAQPNAGHLALAAMESDFNVSIITQNIDDLHERAGSTNVLHLHGKIWEARSSDDPDLVYPIEGWELEMGKTCEKGSQLRPNIVWFGEMVPMMEPAMAIASEADYFMVVGTSLVVYPAAGLLDYIDDDIPVFVIDPKIPATRKRNNITFLEETATTGVGKVHLSLLDLIRS